MFVSKDMIPIEGDAWVLSWKQNSNFYPNNPTSNSISYLTAGLIKCSI